VSLLIPELQLTISAWNASQKVLKSEVKKIVVDEWEKRGRVPMVDAKRARL
jgi:hypothetical protein